ncbi:MAG: type I-F CRISPR-associated protein Csy3 [Desulfotalea sp.]|nr:MAG: type I-F CRISPR-associated protein Csy3 [Desulfotalea sp.]
MAVKTASVLAFEKKLANSDALLHCGNWEDRDNGSSWEPITIRSKDVRGTISHRLKSNTQRDPAKLDAEIQKANLQRVDVADLPFATDTLKMSYTLRVLGGVEQPSACNDQEYQIALGEAINEYIAIHKFQELGRRYAANIANGRFLWRNRIGAEQLEVRVRSAEQEWVFDCNAFNLRSFGNNSGRFAELAEEVTSGLLGEKYVFLQIEAFARLGAGQEVFPSQELILGSSRDNKKSKTLYQVAGVAALHSQKIGNALRTIDTWYPGAEELGPIAVEPYGSVTSRGKAYRQPKEKLDFYTLLDGWVIRGKLPAVEQQHYVMATLIRGGVFGEKAE